MRKDNDKLDVKKLNEIIGISNVMLKIILVLGIVGLILGITFVFKEWNIIGSIGKFLLIIAPFFIGLVIAWLFDPIVTKLKSKGVNRVLGSIMVYFVVLGIFYLIISLMIPILSEQINDFVASIPAVLSTIKDFIGNIFDRLSAASDYDFSGNQIQMIKSLENFGLNLATKLPDITVSFIKSLISGGATLALGLIVGFYLLVDFDNVNKRINRLIPKKYSKDISELFDELNRTLRNFVQGTCLICLIVFIAQSLGFTLASLKAPLVFGIFCAITNVIPYVGPYIGGIPAVIVGFSMSPLTGIFTLISVVVVQGVESNILQPIVMSKTMKLHPVTILLSLLIFGYLFGIIGMILATPIVSCLKIIFKFIDRKWHVMSKIYN